MSLGHRLSFAATVVAILNGSILTAQMIQGRSADATFSGLDKSGGTVRVDILSKGKPAGSISFIADGRSAVQMNTDFASAGVTGSTLNLYSGGTRVASVPFRGPALPEVEFYEELLHSASLGEDDW